MQAVMQHNWQLSITIHYHKSSDSASKSMYIVQEENEHTAVLSSMDSYFEIISFENFGRFVDTLEVFRIRQQLRVSGKEYSLGDFRIRIGSVYIANESRMFVVEIEFLAAMYLVHGVPSIQELMSYFDPFGQYSMITVNYPAMFKLEGETFTHKLSLIDLLVALNCIIA